MSNFNLTRYSDDDLRSALITATLAGVRSTEEREWCVALREEYENRHGAERANALWNGVLNITASW